MMPVPGSRSAETIKKASGEQRRAGMQRTVDLDINYNKNDEPGAYTIGNLTLLFLDRAVFKYADKSIVFTASGKDYEDFQSHFLGWYIYTVLFIEYNVSHEDANTEERPGWQHEN